jgi:hypothetical protein
VAVDSIGNLFITDVANSVILKSDPAGNGGIYAGLPGQPGFANDGGAATKARLSAPAGVALDAASNLYIADAANNRLRKVGVDGNITTVARSTLLVDGQSDVVVDRTRSVYFSEENYVQKVTPDGTVTFVAGALGVPYPGDGGLATNASLASPPGLAMDAAGNLYIADHTDCRGRKATPENAFGVPSINYEGVVSASVFGTLKSFAPGSWIEIYGSNLAPDSRSWTTADFQATNAPTSLDGTTVTIGGQAAFIDYIRATHVNAQVPSGVATGQQQITVTTTHGVRRALSLNNSNSRS